MERLTFRTELGVSMDRKEDCPTCSICWNCDIPHSECHYIDNVLNKLAEYEDLEEQGKLLKLPCKVGDTVYVIGVLGCETVEEYKVTRVDYSRSEFYIETLLTSDPRADVGFYDNEFGKSVFLTKSKAEAKLKELKGN